MSTYAVEPVRALLSAVDPRSELAPCGLGRLVLGSGALDAVADTLSDLLGSGTGTGRSDRPRVVLLVDPTPISRGGVAVKDVVRAQLAPHFDVRVVVLDDGHRELHVVDAVLDEATAAASGVDAVVALGGGTISDIGKVAVQRARLAGEQPVLVTVQTAASVDGYTDDVSVVLRGGVKRTVPSCWPDAVVADAETIAEAPAAMNRAGYGEMTSMYVAPADWRLASMVGTDLGFRSGAVRLLEVLAADLDDAGPGVREADPVAVATLTRALALRGIATGVAGTTAVLSGVEHLVSHMLDQHHTQRHEPMGLHGAQVGVGAVVAAAAWEMLLERMSASGSAPVLDESALDHELAVVRVVEAFGDLDPSGAVGRECWRDYSVKLDALAALRPRLLNLLAHWDVHAPELRSLVRPSATIAAGLRAAGAASTFAELDPVVPPDVARWAVASCALMRNRFTVVDLLTLLGWWGSDDVAEVLDRAARAAAGVTEAAGAR